MNQDEHTREELVNHNNSILRTMMKENEDSDNKTTITKNKKSKYSQQRKDKSSKSLVPEKKRVKFNARLEDIVHIESFKSYNQKMCFDDYKDHIIETKKTWCEENCMLF
jgi:hypothetical protein